MIATNKGFNHTINFNIAAFTSSWPKTKYLQNKKHADETVYNI